MPPRRELAIVASTRDELGRTIILSQDRWDHILDGHNELDGLEGAVMRVVESADKTADGNFPGAKVLYGENLGPARYLAVVVAYEGRTGQVITAYPLSKEPKI